ncbi:MAG: TatD family hydrolase [Bacteroidales bacterium]|nr:TatD family hydrolase [Bacteroidales bacterium]
MYINIHTHQQVEEKDVLSIINLNVPERFCRCGLDLENTNYSLGIHPWKIHEQLLSENLRYIEGNAAFKCVKAIGECGLDKLTETSPELQERAFLAQIHISEKLGKPLIIHCVKALDELIALKKETDPRQVWMIHGFRGKPEQMHQLTKLGFFLSFGEHFNEDTIRQMPLDKMFLETDDKEISIRQVYKNVAAVLDRKEEFLIGQIESNYHAVFD